MIYYYDKDGKVSNKYDPLSGIKIILEYELDGVLNGSCVDKSEKKVIRIACPDKAYMNRWIDEHENIGICSTTDSLRAFPISCILVGEKNYNWWKRKPIEIDYNKDYHFYYNKPCQTI